MNRNRLDEIERSVSCFVSVVIAIACVTITVVGTIKLLAELLS